MREAGAFAPELLRGDQRETSALRGAHECLAGEQVQVLDRQVVLEPLDHDVREKPDAGGLEQDLARGGEGLGQLAEGVDGGDGTCSMTSHSVMRSNSPAGSCSSVVKPLKPLPCTTFTICGEMSTPVSADR